MVENEFGTFTVKELIEHLKKYPENMPIVVTWESISRSIDEDHVYMGKDVLIIDADYNSYRKDFEGKRSIWDW